MAWSAGVVGFANPLFLTALAVSCLFSGAFVVGMRKHANAIVWIGGTVLLGTFALSLGSIVLLIQLGLLVLAAIARSTSPSGHRVAAHWPAMACMAFAFAVGALIGLGESRKLNALREQHPVVSLDSRLRYESAPTSPFDSTLQLQPAVLEKLERLESAVESSSRSWMLQRLHDERYERFVRSAGFGVGRMGRPHGRNIERLPLEDIAFDDRRSPSGKVQFEWHGPWSDGFGGNADRLHAVNYLDFLDPDGFGATFDGRRAAGFIEHALHHPADAGLEDDNEWSVARLELVSLLRFDEPRVYVLDHLPRMDQLNGDDVPTRAIDDFESSALEQLRTEKDIVVEHVQDEHYRMLGSLRAVERCLDCHTVHRGELLGAFTYILKRAPTEEVAE